jgi:hypothetical protein
VEAGTKFTVEHCADVAKAGNLESWWLHEPIAVEGIEALASTRDHRTLLADA